MELFKNIKSKIGVEIKAGLGYTLGNFFLKGVAFLTVPIFTRLLTPSDFGIISLYTTWVGVFTILVGLSLDSSVIRAYQDFKEDYDQYLSSVLFLSVLSLILTLLLGTILRNTISNIIGFPYYIIMLIIFQSYFVFIIGFNNMRYISQYLYKKSLLISISNTVIGVIISIFLVLSLSESKYLGKIMGMFIPVLFIGITVFCVVLLKGKKLVNIKYWKYALFLSIPMIPHVLAHLILGQSDRVLIDRYIGSDAVGIYSFAYSIGLISQVLLGSLNNAWVPWFYKKMDENDKETIIKVSQKYIAVFSFSIIALIYISPELIKIMGPVNYWEASTIIPIVILAYFFQFLYTLLVNIQFYLKKNYFIPVGTIVAAILNIGLNIYFIPLYGYMAAAYTTLVSYIVLFLMHYFITNHIFKSNVYKFYLFLRATLIITLFTLLFYLIQDVLLLRLGVIGCVLVYFWTKNKSTIVQFLRRE